jgi:hypothetical protein
MPPSIPVAPGLPVAGVLPPFSPLYKINLLSKLFRNVLWFDSLELSSKGLTVQITATGLFVFHLALQG